MMDQADRQGPLSRPPVDIRDVRIDGTLSREERVRSFVEQAGDPYRFRVGDVTVRVSYSGENATLNDRFTQMLSLLE